MKPMRLDPKIIAHEIETLLVSCPELAEDEQLRHDMVEGETEAFTLLSILVRRIGETASLSAASCAYRKELAERAARLDRRVEAYRTLAQSLMERAALRKAELPEATLSIGKGRQKLIVSEPEAVPEPLCKIELIPNKDEIREALELGAVVDWAAIVTGDPTLIIRTK